MILAPLHADIREVLPCTVGKKQSKWLRVKTKVFPNPALSDEIPTCNEESLPVSQKV